MRGDGKLSTKEEVKLYEHCTNIQLSEENSDVFVEYILNEDVEKDEEILKKFNQQIISKQHYAFNWNMSRLIRTIKPNKSYSALCQIFDQNLINDILVEGNPRISQLKDLVSIEILTIAILQKIAKFHPNYLNHVVHDLKFLKQLPEDVATNLYEKIKLSNTNLFPYFEYVMIGNDALNKKYSLIEAFENTIRNGITEKSQLEFIENFNVGTDLITKKTCNILKTSPFGIKFNFLFEYASYELIGKSEYIDKIIYICLSSKEEKNRMLVENDTFLDVFDISMDTLLEFFAKTPKNFMNLCLNQSYNFMKLAKNHEYINKEQLQERLITICGVTDLLSFVLNKTDLTGFHLTPNAKRTNYHNIESKLKIYLIFFETDDYFKRLCVAILLLKNDWYFQQSQYFNNSISCLNEYNCPVESIYESFENSTPSYDFTESMKSDLLGKETYMTEYAKILSEHTDFIKTMMESYSTLDIHKRYLLVRTLSFNMDVYKDLFLNISDNSKMINELICNVYAKNPQLAEHIIPLLESKTLAMRRSAFNILKFVDSEKYKDDIEKAFNSEKNAKLKTEMEIFLKREENIPQDVLTDTDSLVKTYSSGSSRRKVDFLYKSELPEVHYIDGSLADENYMRSCLISYASDAPTATNILTSKLKLSDLNAFAVQVFYNFLDDGAEAKKRWVIYFCSIYGGSDMVEILKSNIKTWAENSRGAIAGEATKALSLNPTPIALMTVDAMSRKYKFKQVKNAAVEALEFAAKELNITKEQLADRIVPNMGFDDSMKLVFDYGERKFDVYLNIALELEVFDEKNKKLKSLPAVSKKDDEEIATASLKQFKDLKKQLKITVTTQRDRLELALSDGRKWTKESFENLFVKNPIMHKFAISLIWGIYENSELISTFRYMEDGSFNNEEEDEVTLPDNATIGIAHPIEMTQESIDIWKEQLDDYEVTQSLVQLEREVYLATDDELQTTDCKRFGGKIMSPSTLSNRLLIQNFTRGEILDAGWFTYFEKANDEHDIMIELNFSGASVGYYDGEDAAKVYEIRFYSSQHKKTDQWTREKNKSYLNISTISKKVFSEVIYQITKVTSTSVETDADWEANKE